ncbi:hypothetical protein [Actinoallomurus iriomotensis]|uniref:Uncharacterized protein n=1 Tax=Actinoallomurus iriomotensis TaxID=478107 RepID=A0A9W6VVZ5_9ACTN|nr:hypothetical protein [Actinoallomurus iriomotensis]GLY87248.1 hypothetical protein Airi02_051770 [Actinoallomurus iriomotensis]
MDRNVERAGEAMRAYTLSADGWREGPTANLRMLLADLMHWCDATQHDFDRILASARGRYEEERNEA